MHIFDENLTVGKNLERMQEDVDSLMASAEELGKAIDQSHGLGKERILELRENIYTDIRKQCETMRDLEKKFPAPKLVCPHCGYDGELVGAAEDVKPEHGGFRMLEIVLRPRQIFKINEFNRMELSDITESYDPFDDISDPNFQSYLDSTDGAYGEVRKFAKGRWLVLCGNCDGYFDGRKFAELCQHHYTCESIEDRWGEKKKTISGLAGYR